MHVFLPIDASFPLMDWSPTQNDVLIVMVHTQKLQVQKMCMYEEMAAAERRWVRRHTLE